MRVAFPIINSSTGGEVYFRLLAEKLSEHGVYAEIIPLPYRYEFIPGLSSLVAHRLKTFDIVHSNADYGGLFHLEGMKYVSTLLHNVFDPCYKKYVSLSQKVYHHGLLRHRINYSINAASKVICISESTRESILSTFDVPPGKLDVILCGIDVSYFSPDILIKKIRKKLLYVGSLSNRKGADLLPRIMDLLPEYRLTCVSNSCRAPIEHPRIKIINNCDNNDLVSYYRASDVLISPSRLEGFGYSIAEAMSCGTPVVCSDTSSYPELVSNSIDGYLVPVDNVSAFEEAIRNISEGTDEERKLLSEAARSKAIDKFDIERMIVEVLEVYNNI